MSLCSTSLGLAEASKLKETESVLTRQEMSDAGKRCEQVVRNHYVTTLRVHCPMQQGSKAQGIKYM